MSRVQRTQWQNLCCEAQGHVPMQGSIFVPQQLFTVNQNTTCLMSRTPLSCSVVSIQDMLAFTCGAPWSVLFHRKEMAKKHLTARKDEWPWTNFGVGLETATFYNLLTSDLKTYHCFFLPLQLIIQSIRSLAQLFFWEMLLTCDYRWHAE